MYYRIRVENREKWLFSVFNVFFSIPAETIKKVIEKIMARNAIFQKKTDSRWCSGIVVSDPKITFFEFLSSFGAIFDTIIDS